jgi:dGTPase
MSSSGLSSLAVTDRNSRGRVHPEKPHRYRSDFERDRDRIIHCSAFRRLEGKTQVFTLTVGNGDDHYRTRMTHTIEVAQIGRTIALALGLNETLTEAVCLAHDLGHSPFGHVGEKVLDALMAGYGGFEHNRQALRIVDLIEHPYPDFPGLNLMYETRLGLLKHYGTYDKAKAGDGTFTERNCSLEGQIADVADRIAYNCHDLEDGMRAGLISWEALGGLEIFRLAWRRIGAGSITDESVRRTRIAKDIIDSLVSDCIDFSGAKIAGRGIGTLGDVYAAGDKLVDLSPASHRSLCEMEGFLLENFYLNKSLGRTAEKVRDRLEKLFEALCGDQALMPPYFRQLVRTEGLQRSVCDYISGMTDRFCLKTLEQVSGSAK